jgi:hypothetical protein
MIAYIGYPGGGRHRAVYVRTKTDARAWFRSEQAKADARGDHADYTACGLEAGTLSDRDAWSVRYLDGTRVYAALLAQAGASIARGVQCGVQS